MKLSLIHQMQVATLGVIVGGAIYILIDSKIFGTKEAEAKAKDDYEKAFLESLIDAEETVQFSMENADLDRQITVLEKFMGDKYPERAAS